MLRQLNNCPDLFDLVEHNPERYPFLLENSGETSELGCYDILFAFPGVRLSALPDGCLLHDGGNLGEKPFLDQLDAIYRQWENHTDLARDSGLPFCGGWFIYLGYELATEIEPVLASSLHQPELPRAIMTEIPAGIVRDKQTGKDFIFANGNDAKSMLGGIVQDIQKLAHSSGSRHHKNRSASYDIQEEEGESYLASVDHIKRYIREGDVFQVNLSRRWQAYCDDGLTVYDAWRRLRAANPSPFAAWARIDDATTLLSSSPERLIEHRQGTVRTRPIAGTYPRSKDLQQDRELSAELLMHPKERAEHIMLVDLERNDLGRICQPGSIAVDDLMVLESYAHVHHIVSSISGKLKKGISKGDIIRAVFPGGTITGCPKVRCMEIIAELEQEARDAYTGSVGYLCYNGDMDLNILIRTITHQNNSYSFRAGAGIVADSDPAKELNETRSKARGLKKIFE
ncbi:MAG: aminodeoxychorismate synthase component I [Gammaproteobacteria bacterium]|nr:MAG: aminodeoxychorismate synthase component I [Gammaproteobacteria bacterium]